MEYAKAVIANTIKNKRGEVISKEALEMMVSQVKKNYMPINIEHDPRIPIQGRIADAYLQEMDGGGYEVIAELELFDETDTLESVGNRSKKIITRPVSADEIIINYDRNFDNPVDSENINNIIEKIGARGILSVKNSVDPISVLEVVSLVAFGAIAKGFLSKIGGDSWEYVRDQIKVVFSRKKDGEKEKILSLSFRVVRNEIEFDVEVLATNPTKDEIDLLFSEGLEELDRMVPIFYEDHISLHKMVFEYKKGEMKIKYAVNKDCFPLAQNVKIIDDK